MFSALVSGVPFGLILLPLAVVIALIVVKASVKILREYERAVVSRSGGSRAPRDLDWCC